MKLWYYKNIDTLNKPNFETSFLEILISEINVSNDVLRVHVVNSILVF